MRHLTDGVEEVLGPNRVLICDSEEPFSLLLAEIA
jgi:hypothetical protein